MQGKRWKALCAAIFLAAASAGGLEARAGSPDDRLVRWRIDRDLLRFRAVATDNVMKILGIRPGMSILDIGAGTGQFAFEFAGRMEGTGTVYATDTNGYCVDHMKSEAGRRGLANLHPVLVSKEGLDEFYRGRRYDLVTVFHVAMPYEERTEYFRGLRRQINPSGRLVLLLYDLPAPFSPADFQGDFRGFASALLREPPGSPFHGILKEPTMRRIRESAPGTPPGDLPYEIARDLNDLLSDTRFTDRFGDESVFAREVRLSPEERRYAEWMLAPFRERGARNREYVGTGRSDARVIAAINKLLIVQRYREHLGKEGLFPPGFTPSIRNVFEKAGYRVEGEYRDLVPLEDLVVLSPVSGSPE